MNSTPLPFNTNHTDKNILAIDNTKQIGSFKTQCNGSPLVIKTDIGNAVEFRGSPDQLVIQSNPLYGMDEFTIEAIVNPYSADEESDLMTPRFFHIEDPDNTNRRITMEFRLNNKNQWWFDGFIKADNEGVVLINSSFTHPLNKWYNVSVSFSKGIFSTYVNGNIELSAPCEYIPMSKNATLSFGCRLNKIHYFKGAICKLITTPKMLAHDEFDLSGIQ